MSQWKNDDSAANSVLWAGTGFNLAPNSSNRSALFGNVTESAIVTGLTVGQFGVDTTEIAVGSGGVIQIVVTSPGSGYTANSTVTFTGGGGSSAAATGTANNTGKIGGSNISNAGSSYETNPSITFAAPSALTFNANSDITAGAGGGANSVIALTSASVFVANDPVTYTVAAGNTAIGGLTSGTKYYIQFANNTVVALSSTPGGSRITLTKGFTESGHTLRGDTATGAAVVGGGNNKGIAHAGWVVRTVGTGNRAGRVQYETLVAMGSMTGDAEDNVLPDS